MKKDKIIFVKNQADGSKKKRKQSRKQVIRSFKKLVEDYPDNNEISKRLLTILPEVDKVIIPVEDLNRNNPYIICQINKETKMLEISRNHKICWKILKNFAAK
mgnify:FL=1